MLLLSLVTLGQLYLSASGCSLPLARMAPRFDVVLMGTNVNHYTRAGNLVDSEFRVFCVMKGDGGRVYEHVFILANRSQYPCTKDTSPMKLRLSYIVGVTRVNERNFSFSEEAATERVAFPFTMLSVNKLKQYCEFQDPKPPFGNPPVSGNRRCPTILDSERDGCAHGAARQSSQQLFPVILSLLVTLVFGTRVDKPIDL